MKTDLTHEDFIGHINDHKHPRKGDWIEISINPADHRQFVGEITLQKRIIEFTNEWKKFFTLLYGFQYIEARLEMAFGRLHWHIVAKLNKPLEAMNSYYNMRLESEYYFGGTSKQKRNFGAINYAHYKIRDEKHLKERLEYLRKDIPVWEDEELDQYSCYKKGSY